ncbi:iron complex outermembrane recepter protein [Rhodanobacter glycinis]|uniref:Iron complex outermembrane recepter protein n=1 Tax=Rhodanobacter glycinis TaxID=582702 RepID=A0A1I4ESB8_9GAMM|nr:TonB-dependent receptor [Rhodanobacter glycinis]SFL08612.1 iron complex outermembrane recepter protein [Rhodanobacter glycinis]
MDGGAQAMDGGAQVMDAGATGHRRDGEVGGAQARHRGAPAWPRWRGLARAMVLATCGVGGMAPVAAAAQVNRSSPTHEAAKPAKPRLLPIVVVTATHIPELAFDVPASITAVQIGSPTSSAPGINASEYLREVPGVLARDRQNYAQDEQISIRGFGSRATFGVVGVRLYADGIPATMPDGQGQVSNFDFGGAERIEVLRGPFSALYGNSSGGVIQIFTADGSNPPEVLGSLGGGSFGQWHADAGARGTYGGFGYNLDLAGFRTEGYREHSGAKRINGNVKLDFKVGDGGKLTVLLNTVSVPLALDPQGLTWAQYQANPRQASPSALLYNTRKSVHQWQGGALYSQKLDAHQRVQALVYYGQRGVQQFLSVPVAAQKNPLNSGGVVDLHTLYKGTDLRWIWQGELAGRPLDFAAGVAYDDENQHRTGRENFAGDTLGVVGALRRNEQDDVYDIDEYAQGTWKFAERWSLTLGARHSVVRFSSGDSYITGKNPDDSGRVAYGSTSPVAGLLFDASDAWHLYASFGKGFETPTFSEIGYRPNGENGLNFGLRPARSRNGEIGSKWSFADGGLLDIALFEAMTRDEIAVLSSLGGRTTYHNVGRARRRGAELGLRLPLGDAWKWNLAYTRLDAHFLDTFSDCNTPATCTIPAGTRIPGVPRNLLHASLRWGGDSGWHAGMSVDAASAVTANDAGTLAAPGYAVAGMDVGYVWNSAHYTIAPYARVDNLFNRDYIGSVIVDQRNGGSFEPAPGRTFWVGVNVKLRAAR